MQYGNRADGWGGGGLMGVGIGLKWVWNQKGIVEL